MHVVRKIVVAFRPEHEMPVVGHDDEAKESDGDDLACLFDDLLERFVVGVAVEECLAADGSIEDVEEIAAGGEAGSAWHGREYSGDFGDG